MSLLELARTALPPPIPGDTRGRHWLIRSPDGELLEVIFGDVLNLADVQALYPDAVALTLHSGTSRRATPTEAAELRALVAAILTDEAERTEALATALADPDGALMCYRTLTQQ